MPVVPSYVTPRVERSAVTLAMYCVYVLHYPEWMFWGVQRDGDAEYECQRYWCKWERDSVSRYLWEAQSEYERTVRFPIGVRWFAAEEVPYKFPAFAKRGMIVEAGVEARDVVQADAAVVHHADIDGNPVDSTVTVATTVTDPDELRVYYPESLDVEGPVEIDPSDVDVAGGNAVISIPRWRMTAPSAMDGECGREGGVAYATEANFLSVVDVVRVHNDPSTNAELVWPHGMTTVCWANCDEDTHDGCMYVNDAALGVFDVLPATYSAGAWSGTSVCADCYPEKIRLNYRAGIDADHELWTDAMDAIVRLAHSKMPEEPCGCDVMKRLWARDRTMPDAMSIEQLHCPFGKSDGAWTAWRFANAMKLHRSTSF